MFPLDNLQIDAIMLGKDAEYFFSGLPPFNPSTDVKGAEALAKRLSWLMSGPQPPMASGPASAARSTVAASSKAPPLLPGGVTDQPGSGVGVQWLDVCVTVGWMDKRRAGLRPDGTWLMPMVRVIDTVAKEPKN